MEACESSTLPPELVGTCLQRRLPRRFFFRTKYNIFNVLLVRIERLENDASYFWDAFYKQNKNKFFKDRHWFEQEFPLLKKVQTILEVGCGTGSSIYPLLSLNESLHVYACDFARSAVELVLEHPQYSTGRVDAFVADITEDMLCKHVTVGSIDACLMIFVLSAISPSRMLHALVNINSVLNKGGVVCFRDYCCGDLSQKRLDTRGRPRKIEENFFARGDGTRAYFFTETMLNTLFEQAHFEPVCVNVIRKLEINRKLGTPRDRKYIQGIFRKKDNIDSTKVETMMQHPPGRHVPQQTRDCVTETEEEELSVRTQVGIIQVTLGSAINSSEETMITFLIQNPSFTMGKITVDVATSNGSGAISFAALNHSNRHVVVSSPRTEKLLRKVFRMNAQYFIYERLRVLSTVSLRDEIAASMMRLPQSREKIVLLAVAPNDSDISNDMDFAARIIHCEPKSSHLLVSCRAFDIPHVCEKAQQYSLKPGKVWTPQSGFEQIREPCEGLASRIQQGNACLLFFPPAHL